MRPTPILSLLAATAIAGSAAYAQASRPPLDSATIAGFRWRTVGPANFEGRVADIVGIPSPSKTFFIAAADLLSHLPRCRGGPGEIRIKRDIAIGSGPQSRGVGSGIAESGANVEIDTAVATMSGYRLAEQIEVDAALTALEVQIHAARHPRGQEAFSACGEGWWS